MNDDLLQFPGIAKHRNECYINHDIPTGIKKSEQGRKVMIYTPLTKIAIQLALDAHRGQYDKGGLPYATHPLHVAESMETEDECVVALLHDVLEDTDMTAIDLLQWGITERQIKALKLLCHDESVPYLEYVQKLRTDPIAVKVKIADLRHNADLTRLAEATEEDWKRVEKYKQALQLLQADILV